MKKMILVLIILVSSISANAQNVSIKMVFTNFRNNNGKLMASLFNSEEAYKKIKPMQTVKANIATDSVVCNFTNVAPGNYIIAALHDENENEQMDYEKLVIPIEGYGFSNNVKPKYAPPSVAKLLFPVNKNVVLRIKMQYYKL